MSISKFAVLLVGVLLVTIVAVPNLARTNDIVITDADVVKTSSTELEQDLATANIKPRLILNYASVLQYASLETLSGSLQLPLGQVSPRVVLNYAQSNNLATLSYPATLIGDTTPPQIKQVATSPFSHSSITLTWETDQYATSLVTYGLQPRNHTQTISDTLYSKIHQITLTDLMSEAIYYYQIRGTNRSGNNFISEERYFIAANLTYLPLLLKNK